MLLLAGPPSGDTISSIFKPSFNAFKSFLSWWVFIVLDWRGVYGDGGGALVDGEDDSPSSKATSAVLSRPPTPFLLLPVEQGVSPDRSCLTGDLFKDEEGGETDFVFTNTLPRDGLRKSLADSERINPGLAILAGRGETDFVFTNTLPRDGLRKSLADSERINPGLAILAGRGETDFVFTNTLPRDGLRKSLADSERINPGLAILAGLCLGVRGVCGDLGNRLPRFTLVGDSQFTSLRDWERWKLSSRGSCCETDVEEDTVVGV
jgi:hypothetical protein